ncbi:MAG TPA: glycosyl hydrolase 53 family protein [Actinophytocola sp.]|uniref:glycoside hydrolase family 53 protein n=1 Tax=Actinophytocola sp. TaxID=1872138 RepID=UPI002DDCA6FF|nr:glycosyl hydrolase 53 family protein [Actinophytocola sp.]HEV2782254.1 glycosyl hydrolase 53 family protein [Actinophytocola sp.]
MSTLRRRTVLAVPFAATLGTLATQIPASAAVGPLIRGADISFTLQEEAAGRSYRDGGVVRPIERILADRGANFIRLRVWTAPPPGYSTLSSALTLARRAHAVGQQVLLNLHYCDFWADPSKQPTPAAWAGQDLPTLAQTVRRYTRDAVAAFARQGTPVAMIQVGNEITNGMLWPLGQIYRSDGEHWAEFTTLLKAGIAGAREGNPAGNPLQIMLHIDRGGDNGGSRYFFDHVGTQGVQFDVIGQSYYPMWHGSLAALRANLNDLSTRYGKPLVLAEVSYPWTLGNGDQLGNFVTSNSQLPDGSRFPATRSGQAAYFEELRAILAAVPGGRGAGFFDWEPGWLPGVGWTTGEGNPNDNLTMFDFSGNALPSLRAFRPGS